MKKSLKLLAVYLFIISSSNGADSEAEKILEELYKKPQPTLSPAQIKDIEEYKISRLNLPLKDWDIGYYHDKNGIIYPGYSNAEHDEIYLWKDITLSDKTKVPRWNQQLRHPWFEPIDRIDRPNRKILYTTPDFYFLKSDKNGYAVGFYDKTWRIFFHLENSYLEKNYIPSSAFVEGCVLDGTDVSLMSTSVPLPAEIKSTLDKMRGITGGAYVPTRTSRALEQNSVRSPELIRTSEQQELTLPSQTQESAKPWLWLIVIFVFLVVLGTVLVKFFGK